MMNPKMRLFIAMYAKHKAQRTLLPVRQCGFGTRPLLENADVIDLQCRYLLQGENPNEHRYRSKPL